MDHLQVAVLGGGITGLCAAHRLQEHLEADAVVVLEGAAEPGGYCRTERAGGFLCDTGPNGFLDKEPLMVAWIDALGIRDELVQANEHAARRFLLKEDRLVELRPPPAFLVSPLLSLKGRARLLCEPFIKSKRDDAPESIWDFAARRIGREAADTLVRAMVTGVFGGDAKALSLKHCFPRMAEMERDYGSLFKAMMAKGKESGRGGPMGPGGTLTSFRDGIGRLTERAAELLGHRLRLGFDVQQVERDGAAYRVHASSGEELRAEQIVVALPAQHAATVLQPVDRRVADALGSVKHAPIAVVCTGYPADALRHDMQGFGFLAARNQGKRVLGCIWTSSVFPHSAPEGHVFLRTMFGGTHDPDAVHWSDEALLDCLAKEVDPLLGITEPAGFVRVYRHHAGIPQYGLDHDRVIDAVTRAEQEHPGLYFAGAAYCGVSLNDCVVSAHRAVDALVQRRAGTEARSVS